MSTEFAPVGPLVAQRALAEAEALGNYQLLIAPVIIRQMQAYAHFYQVDYPGQHIIIDNGVVELGYPLPLPDLYLAARTVNAQVVVMPDTIDDGKMTAKQAQRFLPDWWQLTSGSIQALGVAQGTTLEECIECARILVEEGIDWLAASKYSTVNLGSRIELVKALSEFGKPIHVLGFSNNLKDDLLSAIASPLVRGIDAATPVWSPLRFPPRPWEDEDSTLGIGRRPKSFWTEPASPHAVENTMKVRDWLAILAEEPAML